VESLNQALVECVKAAGGSANVGPKLWPEKSREAAQRALLDCLNEDRPAKLSPEQVLLVLRLARAKGFHDGMNFIASDLGYGTPVPIEPRDEYAELQKAFIESVKQQQGLVERMERVQPQLRSVA
jgi:hypothetical protein